MSKQGLARKVLPALMCVLFVSGSHPSQADIVESRVICADDRAATLAAAVETAKQGLSRAIDAVDEGTDLGVDRFARWFGAPSSDAAAEVRQIFQRALTVVGVQTFWCPLASSDDLQFDGNTPASAYPKGAATEIFLGSNYFDLPDTGENSKAGVLVHELTHLVSVGPTGDRAFTMREAEVLAEIGPIEARASASNYQFFFEDVLFGLSAPP